MKDATISTLSTEVGEMVTGLRGLKSRLGEVRDYLRAVLDGRLPLNHDILRNLQVGVVLEGLGRACGWLMTERSF